MIEKMKFVEEKIIMTNMKKEWKEKVYKCFEYKALRVY
jgi:hypothetical protein